MVANGGRLLILEPRRKPSLPEIKVGGDPITLVDMVVHNIRSCRIDTRRPGYLGGNRLATVASRYISQLMIPFGYRGAFLPTAREWHDEVRERSHHYLTRRVPIAHQRSRLQVSLALRLPVAPENQLRQKIAFRRFSGSPPFNPRQIQLPLPGIIKQFESHHGVNFES